MIRHNPRGSKHSVRCACGSDLNRFPLHDAAGIFLCFACHSCVADVKQKFRPEVFEVGTPYAATGDEVDLWACIESEERFAP